MTPETTVYCNLCTSYHYSAHYFSWYSCMTGSSWKQPGSVIRIRTKRKLRATKSHITAEIAAVSHTSVQNVGYFCSYLDILCVSVETSRWQDCLNVSHIYGDMGYLEMGDMALDICQLIKNKHWPTYSMDSCLALSIWQLTPAFTRELFEIKVHCTHTSINLPLLPTPCVGQVY